MFGEVFRHITTFSWHDCKSDTSCWLLLSPNTDHGLNSSLTLTLSATFTASFSIATPLSEKKHFCVYKVSRAKFCTLVMITSSASRITDRQSKLMLNGATRLLAPLTTSAVNWRNWRVQGFYENGLMTRNSKLDFIFLLKRTTRPKIRLWGPGRQDVPYIRANARGDALQLPLVRSKRLIFSLTDIHSWATDPTRHH